jgi:NEDD8-activating enzyme E1
MGFKDIHVIDMDTIDLSNLNRQFLFRSKDIGKPKAQVAADFINNRVPTSKVTPHYCKIQDKDVDFYRQFNIIVCGLDSIVARRWINGLVISLLEFEENTGNVDQTSIIPVIDGGTEGFKGNARVILPGLNACIDCTLDLYPPQVTYPLCTIAATPRLPEHCIEYARLVLWPQEKPFGDSSIDGDDPAHIKWLFDKSSERAAQFGIQGVTYRLTQGVIKNIIPAVASTNACIAAICASEVFKLATSCSQLLNNYIVFNQADGIYTYIFEAEKKQECLACNRSAPKYLEFKETDKLQDIIDFLCNHMDYQMRSPAITTQLNVRTINILFVKLKYFRFILKGKPKTLYMASIKSIEELTRPNLEKTLNELSLTNGQELLVADSTTPNTIAFYLKFK